MHLGFVDERPGQDPESLHAVLHEGIAPEGTVAAPASTAIASGRARPTSVAPVVDITLVSVRTRSGCSIAII